MSLFQVAAKILSTGDLFIELPRRRTKRLCGFLKYHLIKHYYKRNINKVYHFSGRLYILVQFIRRIFTLAFNNEDLSSHETESECTNKSNSEGKMVVVRAVKDILSIKIKTRHDSYTDQFSRLFMTKMLLIASLLMSFDYFSDRVSCMVHKESHLSKDFIHSACWISGFYIYKEMTDPSQFWQSGYYGIPRRPDFDGIADTISHKFHLCQVKDQFHLNKECRPMTRVYYLHYQWLPFYIGALAVLYYLPYIGFRIVNVDLISLKTEMKSLTSDADKIVKNYFNYKINPISKLRLRVLLNICIKLLYIAANVFAFLFTDQLLYKKYINYGPEYLRWSDKNTTLAHSPIHIRLYAKPGKFFTRYFLLNIFIASSIKIKKSRRSFPPYFLILQIYLRYGRSSLKII